MNQVIVFDMDDTLYLEKDYIFSGYAAIEQFILDQGVPNDFARIAMEQYHHNNDNTVINRALLLLGDELPPSVSIPSCLAIYREHMPAISLCEDSLNFLNRLPPDTGTALISDGRLRGQQNKANALRLDKHIELLLFTDVWGTEFWKPHKKAFVTVMEHFKHLDKPHFTYIGDNPKKDFIAPQALGWDTVFINRKHSLYASSWTGEINANRQIDSFDQLDYN